VIKMSEIGPQGWKQFIQNRQTILDKIDRIRRANENQEVQTEHGFEAENALIDWLNDFLPKRFGVTKGYVVSDDYKFWNEQSLEEYDIISMTGF